MFTKVFNVSWDPKVIPNTPDNLYWIGISTIRKELLSELPKQLCCTPKIILISIRNFCWICVCGIAPLEYASSLPLPNLSRLYSAVWSTIVYNVQRTTYNMIQYNTIPYNVIYKKNTTQDQAIHYNLIQPSTMYDISCKMYFVGVQCTMYNVRCIEYLCFLYIVCVRTCVFVFVCMCVRVLCTKSVHDQDKSTFEPR